MTEGNGLSDIETTKYRSIGGALQYLTVTRPDISFAINKVYQFLYTPTYIYSAIVKRICGICRMQKLLLFGYASPPLLSVPFQMQIEHAPQMVDLP